MRRWPPVLAVLVVLAAPQPARGGTVSVEAVISHDVDGEFVVYEAAPGEANDLRVSYADGGRTIHVEDRAGVTALSGCMPAGPLAAICVIGASEHDGDVWRLNDGNDRLVVDGDLVDSGELSIFGGTGDDVILGSASADDIYDGAGRDSVSGRGGNDTLWSGPGADDLSGGADEDTVSYDSFEDERRHGVHADLDGRADDGWPGEHDRIRRDVEHLDGSDHGDVLRGDGRANAIDGGFGDDRVFGAGGDDVIDARLGADVVDLGAGRDRVQGGRLIRARDGERDRIEGCNTVLADRRDSVDSCSRVHRR